MKCSGGFHPHRLPCAPAVMDPSEWPVGQRIFERGIPLIPWWFGPPRRQRIVRPGIVRYVCDNLLADAFELPLSREMGMGQKCYNSPQTGGS